ncbi:MAG: stage 0 sporulation family protein [Candidatus Omnitrophica bacterium]|nr:stage 0 sporulation family protein [Candidatus Omnitrophota bacterium]
MEQLIEVKLGECRPVGIYDANGIVCVRGDIVIVEMEKGSEFGKVVNASYKTCSGANVNPAGKVLRLATEGDLRQIVNNQMKAKEALQTCQRKVVEARLDMQLVSAEYSFDSAKILFFFTSEGRVDFRNLVKDLAKMFRARIELKQIGVRDKAKIVGGIGVCGRELCCSSYMKGFHPLSIKMAKDQGLPLNPSKISGVCGRVKCCMAYEYQVYREMSRELPRMGAKVTTEAGEKGRVIAVDILKRSITVDLGEGKTTRMTYASSAHHETAPA